MPPILNIIFMHCYIIVRNAVNFYFRVYTYLNGVTPLVRRMPCDLQLSLTLELVLLIEYFDEDKDQTPHNP